MNEYPRKAAVLGSPISHSLSPLLHSTAYQVLGLAGWDYGRHDVSEADLREFLKGLDDSWVGLSLTMPLKQAVFPLLDHIEPLAQVTGAVNTVLFSGAGKRRISVGTNTDVHGIVAALKEGGTADKASQGAIIGAGATASSAMAALAEFGCADPTVYVRNLGRTAPLRMAAQRMGTAPKFVELKHAVSELPTKDLVISTLPPFAADPLARALQDAKLSVRGVLLDVAYDPAPTALVSTWRHLAGRVNAAVTGERMLLHQAAEQVRLMTGHVGPVAAMSHALDAELAISRA